MDTSRFDDLAAALSGSSTRRDTLRLLGLSLAGAGGLTLLAAAEGDAKQKRKRKGKSKGKGKGNKGNTTDRCLNICGGECPRCAAGTTCTARGQCSTAFCDGGVCSQPESAGQCGTDTNGDPCARRVNDKGVAYCSRFNGNFINNGVCSQCAADEQCTIIPDMGVECLKLCGAPL